MVFLSIDWAASELCFLLYYQLAPVSLAPDYFTCNNCCFQLAARSPARISPLITALFIAATAALLQL